MNKYRIRFVQNVLLQRKVNNLVSIIFVNN